MNEYVVHIEKKITTAHYLIADSADSAEAIVLDYVLNNVKNQEINSDDFLEEIEVTCADLVRPQKSNCKYLA